MIRDITKDSTKRIYGLDILRAFAILFVVYVHGLKFLEKTSINQKLLSLFVFNGVSIFFVLSGFLIGGILLKEINKKEQFKLNDLYHFWIRRWFRTLPNYYLVLTFIVVMMTVYSPMPFWEIVKYYLFLQNFAWPQPEFFPESWSLTIEEWFYLLVPLMIFLILRMKILSKQYSILFIISLVIIISTTLRIREAILFSEINNWDVQVILRLDGIMFGFLAAYLKYYHYDKWIKRKNLLFFAGLFIFIFFRLYTPDISTDYFIRKYLVHALNSVGTFLLLPKLFSIKNGKGFIFRFFTFISLISYSMYLLNLYPVIFIILPRVVNLLPVGWNTPLVSYILFWLFTVVLSYLLYTYFEKPMMNLREKYNKNTIQKNESEVEYNNSGIPS